MKISIKSIAIEKSIATVKSIAIEKSIATEKKYSNRKTARGDFCEPWRF